MAINFSDAKLDSVRMAFEVVMLERLAKSSRERKMLMVAPSSSNPYVSYKNMSDSAKRPRMCFCVRFTVRSSEMPKSMASNLMKNIAKRLLVATN